MSKLAPKGDTVIVHYHSVHVGPYNLPERQYRHHDWHDEEIVTANKTATVVTLVGADCKTYKKLMLSKLTME